MRSRADTAALALVAALTISSCAAPGVTSRLEEETTPTRGARNVISRAEIEASNLSNALELIHALRPTWLTHRGQESMALGQGVDVYVDGHRQDRQFLTTVPLNQVERLEFLSPTEATFRFGTQEGSGAILVTMRRR